ncbi:FAD/NAD(P)-binding protein [Bradyrhizobium sp. 31Argb]|uniref:FAD/NAD(P)-binding protein n=1 Tax=Bradyrhizobium sp. 31Argb TaxID=3141247 RepID=UPI0037486FDF
MVIGSGARGVLLAFQLLTTSPSNFRATLIEKRPEIVRGQIAPQGCIKCAHRLIEQQQFPLERECARPLLEW